MASCYRNALEAAKEKKVKTIAFPSISTGAYGFPLERATEIALKETKKFLATDKTLTKVVFVCFGEKVLNTYREAARKVFLNRIPSIQYRPRPQSRKAKCQNPKVKSNPNDKCPNKAKLTWSSIRQEAC